MEMIDLQNRFAAMVVSLAKVPWDEIRIRYENANVDGIPREIHTSSTVSNGIKQRLKLPLQTLDILLELQKCKPQGQSDCWTWLEFVIVHKTGKYKFDYHYDNPPMIMEQAKYSKGPAEKSS
jgi:hypothetical protein